MLKNLYLHLSFSEFLRNISIAIMTPLISFVSINLLRQGEIYLGVCNGILSLGYLVFSYTSGRLSDRYDKKKILQIVTFLFVFSLVGLYLSYQFEFQLYYFFLIFLGIISFGNVLYENCMNGYIKIKYDNAVLLQINSILKIAFAIASFISPFIFVWVINKFGFQFSLILLIFFYIIIFCIITFMFEDTSNTKNSKYLKTTNFLKNINYVLKNKLLITILVSTVLINLSFSILDTLLPIHVIKNLDFSNEEMLTMWSFVGIGQFLGSIVCLLLKKQNRNIYLIIGLTIPCIILLNYKINYLVLVLILICINCSRSIGSIIRLSSQQKNIKNENVGTILGVMTTITYGVNLFGSLISGYVCEYFGINIAIIISVIFLLSSNIFMYKLKD